MENSLSKRLTQLRTDRHGVRGVSDFARELGVSMTTYYSWEHGTRPAFSALRKISEATACNLVWLLTGLGDAAEASNKYADDAVAEAIECYGESAAMERIKDETLNALLRKLAVRDEQLDDVQKENQRLRELIVELRETVARLQAKEKP